MQGCALCSGAPWRCLEAQSPLCCGAGGQQVSWLALGLPSPHSGVESPQARPLCGFPSRGCSRTAQGTVVTDANGFGGAFRQEFNYSARNLIFLSWLP